MSTIIGEWQGRPVHQVVLENDHFRIELLDFGARIRSCYLKQSGVDVVQGFDDPLGYSQDVRYMGATVGRVANRIKQGFFDLNGQRYTLSRNDKGNTLHGGENAFDLRFFEIEEQPDAVVFSLISPDRDEGFPGTLKLNVRYRLLSDGWAFDTEAISDQDTLCSITNHAFFNLNGQDSITALDHRVKIEADDYSRVDDNGLTLPEICSVADTPFDFRQSAVVGERMDLAHADIRAACGYDHNFLIRGSGLRPAAEVSGSRADMKILTTMPCLHFYSSNFLGGTSKGKAGAVYPKQSSLCFEPQYFPNAIQYDCAEAPILKANEVMRHSIEYHFNQR